MALKMAYIKTLLRIMCNRVFIDLDISTSSRVNVFISNVEREQSESDIMVLLNPL